MADITTTRQFTDGERGITAQKLNDIIGSSTIQPAFYASKPTAPTADPADIALVLKAGAYAQVPISGLASSVTQAQIWSSRLRSFNSIGNPNFEVDQRGIFQGLANPPANTFVQDRWIAGRGAGTWTGNWNPITVASYPPAAAPFWTSKGALRFSITANQAVLSAGDNLQLFQHIEGSSNRELMGDVTSLSLLVRSSIPSVKFSVSLRDNPATQSLTKLCTSPATVQNWGLIQLPNLPIYPTGANFGYTPGNIGYDLTITLACGSTYTAPAADVWQAGNFIAAPGTGNFVSNPVANWFDVAFVQHEPGSVCTTFMDKSFDQNYEECQRYFQKTYNYFVKPGAVDSVGSLYFTELAGQHCYGSIPFKKTMAKVPTITPYSYSTGVVNAVRDNGSNQDRGCTAPINPGDSGFGGFVLNSQNAVATIYGVHYAADVGW